VLNGRGGIGDARLLELDRRQGVLQVDQVCQVPRSTPRVTLVIGALKQSAWDELLPHLVELGVERIVRWQSRHAVSDVPKEKREAKSHRWRERMIQACKQSANPWLPEIEWVEAPEQLEEKLPQNARHVLASLSGETVLFRDWERGADEEPLVAWVGPEGDFTEEELNWIRSAFSADSISLGDQILRAETAALSLVTLLRLGG